MTSVSPLDSTALLTLRQATLQPSDDKAKPADQILAAANGLASGDTGAGTSAEARAKINGALFDRSVPDSLQMKISLMRRLGEEFGLDMDKFESQAAFGAAIERAVGAIKIQDGGVLMLTEIERKLGLDKLGISLDTLVNAIIDPDSDDSDKLDAALKTHLGELAGAGEKDGGQGAAALVRTDEDGLYGV